MQQNQRERSVASAQQRGLRLVRALLDRLHEADLPYCHWKSNEHLGAAVEGLTDLDVLVERRCATELHRTLAEVGFKRFAAPPLRAYPAIEDYLGLDLDTGRLVHLHLHWELTLGEAHLKGYHLPWESWMLATRRYNAEHGIYVADARTELLLLLVRAALKHRARDRLRRRGGKAAGLPSDFQREFAWLRLEADPSAVMEVAHRLISPALVEPLRRVLDQPHCRQSLLAFGTGVRHALARYRTYGRFQGRVRAWLREAQWITDVINRRYLHRATPLRRLSPRGGIVIALLGADGSGKSTLARTLCAWLGAKLDVLPVYLGSGDGPSAAYRRPLRMAYRLLQPVLREQPRESSMEPDCSASTSVGLKARVRAAARVPWAVLLSCEKRSKLRRVTRGRNRGMIVVCDRFVQADVTGFNDGPLLDQWRKHPWRLCRSIAAWEARPYREARLNPPDLVIKLAVSPTVALARRPEMSLPEVIRRVRAVHEMRFPPSTRVIELNADASLDQVASAAKRVVWSYI